MGNQVFKLLEHHIYAKGCVDVAYGHGDILPLRSIERSRGRHISAWHTKLTLNGFNIFRVAIDQCLIVDLMITDYRQLVVHGPYTGLNAEHDFSICLERGLDNPPRYPHGHDNGNNYNNLPEGEFDTSNLHLGVFIHFCQRFPA